MSGGKARLLRSNQLCVVGLLRGVQKTGSPGEFDRVDVNSRWQGRQPIHIKPGKEREFRGKSGAALSPYPPQFFLTFSPFLSGSALAILRDEFV
jgi:hypothetical protein